MKKLIFAVLVPFAFAGTANAQSVTDVSGALTQGWAGTASLGAAASTGNSETSSVSGSINLGKTVGRWEHRVTGNLFKGESSVARDKLDEEDVDGDGDTTETLVSATGLPQEKEIVKGDPSDRIALGYKPRFYWKPRTYFFGLLDWEKDKPGNIDTAFKQVVGIGHKFYNNDKGFFSGEIGFGNKNLEPVNGSDIDGGIGYLALNFRHNLNESAAFTADLESDFGSDNTFIELGLGLAFAVSDGIRFKISHFTRNNSDLKDPNNLSADSSDSITTLNLEFDI